MGDAESLQSSIELNASSLAVATAASELNLVALGSTDGDETMRNCVFQTM